MPEAEICEHSEQRDDWHGRWLTMQSAYAEFSRTSDVLKRTSHTGDEPLSEYLLRLTILQEQQRLAFERYIDARIAFLEFRFDGFSCSEPGVPDELVGETRQSDESHLSAWLAPRRGTAVLQCVAVILLCTMAGYLIREQKMLQSLEAGRAELAAGILHTDRQVQLLGQRLDLVETSQSRPYSGLSSSVLAPQKPADLLKKPIPKANRGPEAENHSRGFRTVSAFSLSPSREFRRVGRLRVMLKSIDIRKGTASLSLVTDTSQVEVTHVRVNQPTWIKAGRHDRLGVVVNRITANHLEGQVLEADNKPDQSASQFSPKADGPQ